jgi:hypothetical protein
MDCDAWASRPRRTSRFTEARPAAGHDMLHPGLQGGAVESRARGGRPHPCALNIGRPLTMRRKHSSGRSPIADRWPRSLITIGARRHSSQQGWGDARRRALRSRRRRARGVRVGVARGRSRDSCAYRVMEGSHDCARSSTGRRGHRVFGTLAAVQMHMPPAILAVGTTTASIRRLQRTDDRGASLFHEPLDGIREFVRQQVGDPHETTSCIADGKHLE